MPLWHRLVVVGVVLFATALVARLIDARIARRELDPAQRTRYRVLRRSVATTVVAVGLLSALLVIPQVRAVAGALLASAVVGIVIGFASQRTIGNFVAGLLIAFTQPLRLGDRVEIEGQAGVVEEIGLTYTFIHADDETRVVIPNEKLASDTIRNATIRARHALAEASFQLPLDKDLTRVVEVLRETAPPDGEVLVTGIETNATVTVRAWTPDAASADRVASDLRLRAHERLRAAGVYA